MAAVLGATSWIAKAAVPKFQVDKHIHPYVMSAPNSLMEATHPRPMATLEPVRFGEFLRDRHLINDDQWLAALADHWSAPAARRRPIGATIVDRGFLSSDVVEAEARAFHDDLEVVEFDEIIPRSEKVTLPAIPVGH
jgi:hypothetical protein